MPPVSASPANTGPRRLNKRQKAAIVVRLLRAEGVSVSLADLPDALQVGLTEEMNAMRYIDRVTLRTVVDEFIRELDGIGLAFPSDMTGTLDVLEGTISADTAARLRRQAGLGRNTDPWDRLGALDSSRLIPILQDESIEIGAVMLSKLKVSKAAELLGLLPGQRARRIAYAMSQTGAIQPATVDRIGIALVSQMDAEAPRAFDTAPVDRVGAILNFSPASTRNDVLEGLDAEDQDFAERVRRAIFTFANIPARLDPRDVPKVTRDVEQNVLVTALAGASETPDDAAAAEFILANMSQRMAGQLREDMDALGKVKPKDADQAMTSVITALRNLETAGEIVLVAEDD